MLPTTPENPIPNEPNPIPPPAPNRIPDIKEPQPGEMPDEVPNPNPDEKPSPQPKDADRLSRSKSCDPLLPNDSSTCPRGIRTIPGNSKGQMH